MCILSVNDELTYEVKIRKGILKINYFKVIWDV